ncbi:MAG: single-strand DNA-binding protein [Acidobacteriota bacterium]|jgi:single-strand DNA-binding protein|nr:single-strand DNA-binding protein [Acidobacteriota bacterium]MDT7777516.1 single-strand DNA-binding protein [Acidobacteriota bacterium]
MSFNKIIIVGNLGRDPELSYTPQGTAVCKFSVATNERRRDKAGEQQDITTWFRVTVWGKQAENVSRYLSKGRKVYLEGRLHMEEWTDREGKPRTTLEVNASDVQFIDSSPNVEGIPVRQAAQGAPGGGQQQTRGGGSGGGAAQPADSGHDIEDDEIPF